MPPCSQSAPAGAVPGRCVGPAGQRAGRASCGRGWAPPGDPPSPNGRCGCLCVCREPSSVAAGSVNPGGSVADTDPSVRAVRGDPCRAALRISRDAAQSPSLQRSCSPRLFPLRAAANGHLRPLRWPIAKVKCQPGHPRPPLGSRLPVGGCRGLRLCTAQTGRPGEEPPRSAGLPCPPHATRFPHGRAAAGGGASHEGRAR